MKLITVSRIAELLDISHPTVFKWMKEGIIPNKLECDGSDKITVFDREEFLNWLETNDIKEIKKTNTYRAINIANKQSALNRQVAKQKHIDAFFELLDEKTKSI